MTRLGIAISIGIVATIGVGLAHAEPPSTYLGASAELALGYRGKGELGFALQGAPLRNLELEVGAIRHDLKIDAPDVWLVSGMVRGRLPLRYGALFAGIGVVTGEHHAANGCTSSGLIDFCGGEDTYVERHWKRAVWIRPELGGEVALGPVALRFALAPLAQLAEPVSETGCIECDDGEDEMLFTMGLHGRIPL